MTDNDSDEVSVETTSVFRQEFLNELDAPASTGAESAVSGVEGLPTGSALLPRPAKYVVRRARTAPRTSVTVPMTGCDPWPGRTG